VTNDPAYDGFQGLGLLPEPAFLVQSSGRPIQGFLPGLQIALEPFPLAPEVYQVALEPIDFPLDGLAPLIGTFLELR
jgi:hypothetical protein